MKKKEKIPLNQLIQNAITAYKNGYINDGQVILYLDFTAKLGDQSAQTLLDKCKEVGVEKALETIGE